MRASSDVYVFGPYVLDAPDGTLRKGVDDVPLTPKTFDILLFFLCNPGRVIPKEELMHAVWPDTSVEDSNLGQQIFHLRRILGEAPGGKPYIETIPKRGYRFAVAVEKRREREPWYPRWMPRRLGLLIAAALLVGVGLLYWLTRTTSATDRSEVRAVTSYEGVELFPALSPDGKQIAFTRTGSDGQVDLYVRQVDGEPPVRLTNDKAYECYPAWSPDGSKLAFMHCDAPIGTIDSSANVYVVSEAGGPERLVGQVHGRIGLTRNTLCWTPDGLSLILGDRDPTGHTFALWKLDLNSGAKRQITFPNLSTYDSSPAVSRDGHTLAFTRGVIGAAQEVFVQDMSDQNAPARQLTRHAGPIAGIAWRSAREIAYLLEGTSVSTLWTVRADGNDQPHRLAGTGHTGMHFSLSADGQKLVYSDAYVNTEIERVPLPAPGRGNETKPEAIVKSTRWNMSPHYSPDGAKIAYVSDRSGHMEIWTASADGSNPEQLSFLKNSAGTPRWSPSGTHIAADCDESGGTHIYLFTVSDRTARRLTNGKGHNMMPSWSRDGMFVYFVSDRSGQLQLWRMPASGTAAPVQLTRSGAFAGIESIDGSSVYYAKRAGPYEVWRVPASGGDGQRVIEDRVGAWMYFAVFGDGIYYLPSKAPGAQSVLRFYSFKDRQSRDVMTLPHDAGAGFAISPDRKWLLIAPGNLRGGDLYLITALR